MSALRGKTRFIVRIRFMAPVPVFHLRFVEKNSHPYIAALGSQYRIRTPNTLACGFTAWVRNLGNSYP
jgi:hypothetical protein